jgi:hypothetical protein
LVLLDLGEPGGFYITPWADRVRLIDANYDVRGNFRSSARVSALTATWETISVVNGGATVAAQKLETLKARFTRGHTRRIAENRKRGTSMYSDILRTTHDNDGNTALFWHSRSRTDAPMANGQIGTGIAASTSLKR